MMEGVSSEAASIAGHLKLSNLVWIYDSNHITIEGSTSLAFSEDVGARFAAYGWNVLHLDDANDTAGLLAALQRGRGRSTTGRRMIVVHSIIGYGAPKKAGTREAHGEPLGEDEIKAAKRFYGWPEDAQFLRARRACASTSPRRSAPAARGCGRTGWRCSSRYRDAHPGPRARARPDGPPRSCPRAGTQEIPSFPADAKGVASRDSLAEGAERDRASTCRG